MPYIGKPEWEEIGSVEIMLEEELIQSHLKQEDLDLHHWNQK
jgi:hypothetical protein